MTLYGSLSQLTIPRKAASSWWLAGGIDPSACVAAYQAKGAASYAASKINLANPGTYDAVEGVAPTWDAANGWIGNGSSYLKTGLAPGVTQNWTYAIRFSNFVLNGPYNALFGTTVNLESDIVGIEPLRYDNTCAYCNFVASVTNSGISSGIFIISGRKCFKNNVLDYTLPVVTAKSLPEIYLFTINQNGAPSAPIGISKLDIYAMSVYNTAIDDTQVTALHNAMNAL